MRELTHATSWPCRRRVQRGIQGIANEARAEAIDQQATIRRACAMSPSLAIHPKNRLLASRGRRAPNADGRQRDENHDNSAEPRSAEIDPIVRHEVRGHRGGASLLAKLAQHRDPTAQWNTQVDTGITGASADPTS
jgi:hypothetical protein